jgi:hypothetical protein
MIVECHKCQAKVDGKVLAKHEEGDPEIPPDQTVYSMIVCPVCGSCLVASISWAGWDEERREEVWTDAIREWPSPDFFGDHLLPKLVANSLLEARKCFKATCYLACAVMCGRSLEGICVFHNTKSKNLSMALDELLTREVIDKKLHKWGNATRTLRNMAAHATEEELSKEDAFDLLEFTKAFCDYVFVLNKRFDEFMKRNENRKKKPAAPAPVVPAPAAAVPVPAPAATPPVPAPAAPVAADEPPELEAEPA